MSKFNHFKFVSLLMFGSAMLVGGGAAMADVEGGCPVTHNQLKTALVAAAAADPTGFDLHFWGVVVNRGGVVCAVAYSGATAQSQWLLSRQIAAAKAFTANGLALDGAPISSGALYNFVQPVPSSLFNPLYGLESGNPVDAKAAYAGAFNRFGTAGDPMVGSRVGGTITFGGGLGLYNGSIAVGGLGLSGDTACADHSTAWRTRANLLKVPTVDGFGLDRITLDNATAHPHCPGDATGPGTQGTPGNPP